LLTEIFKYLCQLSSSLNVDVSFAHTMLILIL
jgi:hypothetical protein